MENFIIRIYRRDTNDRKKIAGKVEVLSDKQDRIFGDSDELRDILNSLKKRPAKKKKDRP